MGKIISNHVAETEWTAKAAIAGVSMQVKLAKFRNGDKEPHDAFGTQFCKQKKS